MVYFSDINVQNVIYNLLGAVKFSSIDSVQIKQMVITFKPNNIFSK